MRPPRQLFDFHDAVRRHPVPALLAIALVLGACAWVSSRAQVDDNMASLLPGGAGSPGEAARLLSDFGALDTLLFDLAMEGASLDALTQAGDGLVARLEATGRFARVQAGPRTDALRKVAGVVLPRRLVLLPDARAELEARLAPERLRATLGRLREQLSSPAAIALKGQLLEDPLELNAGVLDATGALGQVRLEGGHLVSRDGQHLLVIGFPMRRALDVDASAALMDELAGVRAGLASATGGRARLSWSGGPRFAAESAALIRGDIAQNFLWSTAIMLLVFGLRFRGLRLLALASVPLGVGVLGATAALVLAKGRVHGLTLGFGSALIGIAMDYPLHLINKAAATPGERGAAYAATTRTVFRGLALGFGTTLMGFLALFLSDFPGLVELAWFACVGLTLAFAATLALVPPLGALLGPQQATPSSLAVRLLRLSLPPGWAALATAAVLAGGGWLARGVVFDGDLRKLDSQNPMTLAEHERIVRLFGQPGDASLAVVHGATAQDALAANDALAGALARLVREGTLASASGLGPLLPAVATQRARASALAGLDLAAARAGFDAVAGEVGFAPQAFDRFWDEVARVQRGEFAPLEPKDLEGTFLWLLVDKALHCGPEGCDVATPLERKAEVGLARLRAAWPQGARLIDSEALAAETVARIPEQLALLCALGVLGNLVFLTAVFRSFRHAALACLPCAVALVVTVGLMALLGVPMNMVSGGGLVLVFGCGVDYGLFALEGLAEAEPDGVEQLGVLLAALTTLAGFGTLAMAGNGAMRALGFSTGVGTAASALVALLLLPGLAQRWIRGSPPRRPAAAVP